MIKESDLYYVKYLSARMKEEPFFCDKMLLNQYSSFFGVEKTMPYMIACFFFLDKKDKVVLHRENIHVYDLSFEDFRQLPEKICNKMGYKQFICPAQYKEKSDFVSTVERIYWSQYTKEKE